MTYLELLAVLVTDSNLLIEPSTDSDLPILEVCGFEPTYFGGSADSNLPITDSNLPITLWKM